MAKHTPGPWTVSRSCCGELEPFSENGDHLLNSNGPLDLEEREANALLIEAAPKLLAALEGVVGRFGKASECALDTLALKEARAAIAKAKGESHD